MVVGTVVSMVAVQVEAAMDLEAMALVRAEQVVEVETARARRVMAAVAATARLGRSRGRQIGEGA